MTEHDRLEEAVAALRYSDAEPVLARVVDAARDCMDPKAVAALASVLSSSGAKFSAATDRADVVSSGGAGSLATILGPVILVASGYECVKVGVPGRPAGALDTLGTLPDFRSNLTFEEAQRSLIATGQVHVSAGGLWAPLDAVLFAFRQRVGAQAVPALAASSILAKKLTAGAGSVVLEQRVYPGGSFGASKESAASAASLFIDAARILGIRAYVVPFDSSSARQPFIGRGEALLAMASIFDRRADAWLEGHVGEIVGLCRSVAGDGTCIDRERWRGVFGAHLSAQGVVPGVLDEHLSDLERARRVTIAAQTDGNVTYDLSAIRDVLVRAQRAVPAAPGAEFTDPVGVVLRVRPGEAVAAGEPLTTVRLNSDLTEGFATQVVASLAATFESIG